jgi:hypothetical protein
MGRKYIDARTFCDFKKNQEELVQVLNHNITELAKQSKVTAESNLKLAVDVAWLKKINGWQLGVISALTIGLIVKMVIG